MNLGRPASIPDSYVRLDLPKLDETLVISMVDSMDVQSSGLFFNCTSVRSLYKQLFNIIDLLYEQTLGCDPPLSVSELIGHILLIEQNLVTWETTLPEHLPLVTVEEIREAQPVDPNGPQHFLKF
jgi:hypothetical protein